MRRRTTAERLASRDAREEWGLNLGFILDIPLLVTVELGRTRLPLQDLLKISEGSGVELSTMVGEPLGVLVHGKPVVRGEVGVVHEKFTLR